MNNKIANYKIVEKKTINKYRWKMIELNQKILMGNSNNS